MTSGNIFQLRANNFH